MVVPDEIAEGLKKFGFGKYEATAYLILMRNGIATAPQLARISGIPKSKIYDVIERLIKKRVIEEFPGLPRKYKARPADFLFNEILEDSKQKIIEMERAINDLKRTINLRLRATEESYVCPDNVIWTVNGRKAFHEKFVEIGTRAKKEVLVVSPTFSRNSLLESGALTAKRHGVVFKGITNLTPENAARIKFYLHLYDGMRDYKGEIPLTIIISDRKECIFRMHYDVKNITNYVGVHSTNPGLVKHFLQYWQNLWAAAKPIKARDIDRIFRQKKIK